jgi:RHS repeat-associated protein
MPMSSLFAANARVSVSEGADLASVTNPLGRTMSRFADAIGRVSALTDPLGQRATFSFDALNRLTQSTDALGHTTLTAPAQSTTTCTFDNANRLTAIARGSQGVTFGYDNANRRTSLVLPNGINVAYGYDSASQLTSISYVNGTTTVGDLSYSYDAAGRRVAQGGSFARTNLPAGISGATYDAGNRLSAWNGNSVTHDLNGNMTAALGQTYSWNERNQLTASTGSVTATFAYDAQGRRRGRTVNGGTTNFLYDGLQPIQELTSGNVLSAELLTGGIDEIFSRSTGAVTQTFLVDALGSTVRLTDSAGAKDTDYTYEAYGKASNDNASNTNTFQYTGRENDGTQLQFNRARYYDPRLARFISEDPIGLAGGINLFTYVNGDPLSRIDPSGEAWPVLVLAFAIGTTIANWLDWHVLRPQPLPLPPVPPGPPRSPLPGGAHDNGQMCVPGDPPPPLKAPPDHRPPPGFPRPVEPPVRPPVIR